LNYILFIPVCTLFCQNSPPLRQASPDEAQQQEHLKVLQQQILIQQTMMQQQLIMRF